MIFILIFCATSFLDEDVSLTDILKTDRNTKQNDSKEANKNDYQQKLIKKKAKNEILYRPDGSFDLIFTAVGDMLVGSDPRLKGEGLFENEMQKRRAEDCSFVFSNVVDIFESDHLTIANLDSTISDRNFSIDKDSYCYKTGEEFSKFIKDSSIEVVTLANNNSLDFGSQGLNDTMTALNKNGVLYAKDDIVARYEINNTKISVLAFNAVDKNEDVVKRAQNEIIREKSNADIVIVSFHWGIENDYVPNDFQKKLAHACVDAGANLVLGHNSKRINPIEKYKNSYIVYSLGNFSYVGDKKPSDMSSYIFQVKFNIKDGNATSDSFRIIPIRISSSTGYNDFVPSPYADSKNINNVIFLLKQNGKYLENAVENYPIDWE